MPAAVILAGGRASRLGGVAKPLLDVGGSTLLDHAVAAVAWCEPIVVVGPEAPVRGDVVWAREDPPFGGPVAAIAAGLAHIENDEVYLLAADTPRAVDAVALLRAGAGIGADQDADGICLSDATGSAQWLLGRYRTAALRSSLARIADAGRNASVRALISGLRITAIPAGEVAGDVDTWDDLEQARSRWPTGQETT